MTPPRRRSPSPPAGYDREAAELLDYHRSMLVDSARTAAYESAIAAAVKPGDVVVDVGCGTGVLSFLACKAGAARVYAVESGPIIELARKISDENGFTDRIEFLDDWSTSAQLPEPVDVLVTETIGNAAVDEGIVDVVIDARRRLLRRGGLVVPSRLQLWCAPVESWDDHRVCADWATPLFEVDYRAAARRAVDTVWSVDVDPGHLLTEPTLVADIDLTEVTDSDVVGTGRSEARHMGTTHGLACWFAAELVEGTWVDNAPGSATTSWGQAFLPVAAPFEVRPGQVLDWHIATRDNGAKWEWNLDPSPPVGTPVKADTGARRTCRPPGRNWRGDVDLTILRLMDGRHTLEGIIEAVDAEFASRFGALSVRDYVVAAIEEYRNSAEPEPI